MWKDFGSTLHRDTLVSMFWCFFLRHLAAGGGSVDMFLFFRTTAPLDLQGQNVPLIRHCILHLFCRNCLSCHASYCLSHNGTWCQTTWWPSTASISLVVFFLCYWKDLRKTRASSRSFIWIGLLMTFGSETTQEYVFWTPFNHACTLLECVKVLSCGKMKQNCTASLWKLWLWQDFVLAPEKQILLKENSSPNLL